MILMTAFIDSIGAQAMAAEAYHITKAWALAQSATCYGAAVNSLISVLACVSCVVLGPTALVL